MKHTPLPFFPERYLFLSGRWTENPVGWPTSDSISRESRVSVKPSMSQSLMSRGKKPSPWSTVLSKDWIFVSNILGSSGWCARLLNRTRIPLEDDLASDISSIALGVRTKDPIRRSRISGRNAGSADELLSLWYPIVSSRLYVWTPKCFMG